MCITKFRALSKMTRTISLPRPILIKVHAKAYTHKSSSSAHKDYIPNIYFEERFAQTIELDYINAELI